jgi:hypothetical protein
MSRTAYSYLNQEPGTATHIDDLHAFLDANLTSWTVGSIVSTGSATLERNFLVLTQGTQEILIIANRGNGVNISYNSSVPVAYRGSTSNAQPHRFLAFAYAPQGGYTTALAAEEYPDSLDFWPATSSPAYRMDFWGNGAPNMDLYFFENSEIEELIIYGGRTSSNIGYGCIIITEDLMDPARGNLDYQTRGLLYLGTSSTGSGSPRPFNPSYTLYDDSHDPVVLNPSAANFTVGNLTTLTGLNQPIDNAFFAREIPVYVSSSGPYAGVFNKDIILETGRMTNTYGTRKGTTEVYVHLYQDLFTVWANGASNPTVS